MIRVGVLGAGFMGGTHARAYHGLPGVEVARIYAASGRRAGPLSEELGTSWTDDLDLILKDDEIAAVSVCLPTTEHRRAVEAAVAAGKHVLVEKPVALSLADARVVVALAERTDRIVMVGQVLRFWPEYVELQRRVEAGEIGRPRSAVAIRRQPFPAWSPLFSRADLTGGAVIDMMIHDYDALNWVLGTPRAVWAKGLSNERSGGWDQVQVMIDYGDASALVDGGMMMPDSYPFTSRLEVLGNRGAMEYHFQAGGRSVEMGVGVNTLTLFGNEGDPERLEIPQRDPYETEIAYFIDCIATGQPAARATPAAASRALAVALAARRSLERNELTEVSSQSSDISGD